MALERAQMKALPVLNKAADIAPSTQACCGACRACVTSDLFTLAAAALAGAAMYLRRVRSDHVSAHKPRLERDLA